MKIKNLLIFILFVFGIQVFGNGRVIEVENFIRSNAQEYMRASYPNTNFSIEVKVLPRKSSKNLFQEESLPFFDSQNIDQINPWDDPSKTIFELMGKIRNVKLTINFLENVEITNEEIFKDRILKSIGLIPGRDKVSISIEKSSLVNKSVTDLVFNGRNLSFILVSAFVLIVLFSFFLLNKMLFNKKSQSKVEDQKNVESHSENSFPSSVTPIRATTQGNSSGSSSSMESLTFSDPTSSLEMIKSKVQEISSSGSFPNLNDMLIFDDLVMKNQRAFSYLIFEFSQVQQDDLLKRGRGEHWYKGYCNAGELDRELFFILDTMLRNRDLQESRSYEDLLIQCWRMGDQLASFLKQINKEDSLCILSYLPKYIAVPIAREVFPGGWGEVLSEERVHKLPDEKTITKYLSEAYLLCPQLDKKSLSLYRNRKDLLSYLKACEVFEEEDVYKVLGKESSFFNVRPPFYKLFQLSQEDMKEIVNLLPLEDWSIAIFNIRREYRIKFNDVLSDKENYLLGLYLKSLDKSPPTLNQRGELRESVGCLVRDFLISKENRRSFNESNPS